MLWRRMSDDRLLGLIDRLRLDGEGLHSITEAVGADHR